MRNHSVKSSAEQRILTSRRRFLQFAGASVVTLPFLRALPGYAQADAPTYLALTLKGNGVVRHTWGADKLGPGRGEIRFRPTLAPLSGLEEYVTVVNGLMAKAADEVAGTHEGGMASLWTGKATQSGPGASIDQLLAAKQSTPRKSVELRALSLNDEVVRTPNNRMIFDASGTPIDPREDPLAAFDQLFGNIIGQGEPKREDPTKVRRELLFAHVDQQLGEVAPRLCNEDRLHLDSLRSGWNELGKSLAQVLVCDPMSPASIQAEHKMRTSSRQMIELLVMCFACDVTRIASLQWSQGRSDLIADFAGLHERHHDLSHQQAQAHVFEELLPWPDSRWITHVDAPKPAMVATHAGVWDALNAIDTFYMGEFAYLLQRLKAFAGPGGGTLLDRTLVAFGSEIDNGAGHDHYNMPYLLAGGAGGRLNRGTVIDFPIARAQVIQQNGSPVGLRYHNDLLVTIAHLFGRTDVTSIGAEKYNQGPLPGLIV